MSNNDLIKQLRELSRRQKVKCYKQNAQLINEAISKIKELEQDLLELAKSSEYRDISGENAHLIAAAPEMYAMLKFLVENDSINDHSIDKEVLTLLAKARGDE